MRYYRSNLFWHVRLIVNTFYFIFQDKRIRSLFPTSHSRYSNKFLTTPSFRYYSLYVWERGTRKNGGRNSFLLKPTFTIDPRVSFFLYDRDRSVGTSGSHPQRSTASMFPESSCRVVADEARRGDIVGWATRCRASLVRNGPRKVSRDHYTQTIIRDPSAENRFARHVIVAIWSTTSSRHDTKISIKPLASEDRISPPSNRFAVR